MDNPTPPTTPTPDVPGLADRRQLGVYGQVWFGGECYQLDGGLTINEYRRYRVSARKLTDELSGASDDEQLDAQLDLWLDTILGPLQRANKDKSLDRDLLQARISPQFAQKLAAFFFGQCWPLQVGNSPASSETPSTGPEKPATASTETT